MTFEDFCETMDKEKRGANGSSGPDAVLLGLEM